MAETARHVLVLEQAGGSWKLIDAEIGAAGIGVLGVSLSADSSAMARRNGSEVVLVPELRTSVCRMLELPGAAADQVERMVALRLELELPYPVAESTWMCEPQMNGAGAPARALLIAAATREIASAEEALQAWDIRGADVEFAPAGLAELALASSPSSGTLAVLCVDAEEATLVMTHARSLCYARHIRLDVSERDDSFLEDWVPQLSKEVKQSAYDYLLRTGNAAPESVIVVGKRMAQPALVNLLADQLDMPVRTPGLPEAFTAGANERGLLTDFPASVGVLLALRRRSLGETSAAPPLRRGKRLQGAFAWRSRTGAMVALSAVLFGVFLGLTFAVQAVRRDAAERLLRDSRPLLGGLEKLQEEVDILRFEEKRQRSMLDAFLALSEALPPEIKVESLSVDPKGRITLSGKASSVEAASDTAMAALEHSKAFVKPQFHGATQEQDGFGFRITCELRGGGAGR